MSSANDASDQTWAPGDFHNPNEELRRSVTIALVFAFSLSTIAVALRLLARKMTGSKFFLDDYLIVIALLFKYGCSIGVSILLYNGLGSHITTIPKKNLEVYFKIGWSNTFVYTGCICFIKLSILALYKRLFATKYMRMAVNAVAIFVVVWTVAIYVAGALLCIPVNKFWDSSVEGTCIDVAKFYYAQQIPNIISDFVILVMPLKVVWGLPIGKSQKLLLSGVFLIGGLTLIFDIVRLNALIQITQAGPDVTYNQAPMAVWTCDEAAVGIVAACLPNLRPLFKVGGRGFWSQLRSFTQRSGKATLDNTTNTSNTSVSNGTVSKPVDTYAEGESVEIPRYNDYLKGVEK